MAEKKRVELFGVSLVGLLMLVTVVPVNTTAVPAHWWRQITPSDFNLDTMTDVHLYTHNAYCTFVHLVDDETETDSFDYNPAANQFDQIWDQAGQNKQVGSYSQSFTAGTDGVVDSVDLRVWKVGNPIDGSSNPATLTIKLTDAVQNGNYPPILGTVEVECTYSSVPTQQQLNSFRLTDTDSHYSTPLSTGHVYTLYVTSNAVFSQNADICYKWDCTSNPAHDTTGTHGCTKNYDGQGQVVWNPTGGGQAAYDHPFIIYVHNFVHSGNIVSAIYDCGAASTFASVSMDYTDGGTVTIYVRTGPNANPPQSWSDWVNEGTGSLNPGLTQNRYVQFEIDFVAGTDDLTTQGVRMVAIGYDTP